MRVLHVHERARFHGGVEQILHDLARGLSARGWPQAVLVQEPGTDPQFAAAFQRVTPDLDMACAFSPDLVVLHKWTDEQRAGRLLEQCPSIQVVHDHDLYCPRRHKYFPLTHRACGEVAGAACVRHLCLVERGHGTWPVRLVPLGAFRRRAEVARRADLLIAGSHYSASELARNRYPRDRIRVVPPVPAALGTAGTRSPGEPGRMLFVGQVIRGKGLDLLLEAAARLHCDWTLDVVGEGRQLEDCRAQARRLGIAQRVHFAGWVPNAELGEWYGRASFTVVPSRWPEPFGMVGLESMSRGRPVVAFDSGGIRDWLENEVSGLLVPAGSVEGLARALERMIVEPGRAATMGPVAAERCRTRYSPDGYLDAMQSAMRQVVSLPATRNPAPVDAGCVAS